MLLELAQELLLPLASAMAIIELIMTHGIGWQATRLSVSIFPVYLRRKTKIRLFALPKSLSFLRI